MPTTYQGEGRPLTEAGLRAALRRLEIDDAGLLWAVLDVETSGRGFDKDRRPVVRFERHIWARRVPHRPIDESLGTGIEAVLAAAAIDRLSAEQSASWGLGQIMGFNARAAGHDTVSNMVQAAMIGEDQQLLQMANFMVSEGIDAHLRGMDWNEIARRYNGEDYRRLSYHERLQTAYKRYATHPTPAVDVRAEQILLGYLGHDPGPVDGQRGPLTEAAGRAWAEATGEARTLEALEAAVYGRGERYVPARDAAVLEARLQRVSDRLDGLSRDIMDLQALAADLRRRK